MLHALIHSSPSRGAFFLLSAKCREFFIFGQGGKTMPSKSGQAEKDQGVWKKNWDDGVYISQRSIWVQTDLNIYEKMVWMCLEKYANGKDAAWPSRSTLAEECSISVSQVKRTISSLISKGLLEKK